MRISPGNRAGTRASAQRYQRCDFSCAVGIYSASKSPANTAMPMITETAQDGVAVSFGSEEELRAALESLRAAHSGAVQTYTPAALKDECAKSPVPLVMLIAGLLGVCGAFAMESFANMV